MTKRAHGGVATSDGSLAENEQPGSRRAVLLLAFLLGATASLAGLRWSQFGIPLPDQLTPVRVTTFVVLVALLMLGARRSAGRPGAKGFTAIGAALIVYALASLIWAPDFSSGSNTLVGLFLAWLTGVTALLGMGTGPLAFRALLLGVLASGLVQLAIASWELATGNHFTSPTFGVASAQSPFLVSSERVAWGTMGNPNDLGGFFLIVAAIWLGRRAFMPRVPPGAAVLGSVAFGGMVLIGLTSLQQARAFQIGIGVLLSMWLFDRLLPLGRGSSRRSLGLMVAGAALAGTFAILTGPAFEGLRAADALRIELLGVGLSEALSNLGLGRGIGAASYLVDTGELPTNLHNIFGQVAMELGIFVFLAFALVLLGWLLTWLLEGTRSRLIGPHRTQLLAMVTVSITLYGVTSSGVLEAPAFFLALAIAVAVSQAPVLPTDKESTHVQARPPGLRSPVP